MAFGGGGSGCTEPGLVPPLIECVLERDLECPPPTLGTETGAAAAAEEGVGWTGDSESDSLLRGPLPGTGGRWVGSAGLECSLSLVVVIVVGGMFTLEPDAGPPLEGGGIRLTSVFASVSIAMPGADCDGDSPPIIR